MLKKSSATSTSRSSSGDDKDTDESESEEEGSEWRNSGEVESAGAGGGVIGVNDGVDGLKGLKEDAQWNDETIIWANHSPTTRPQ